jgi:selenide, water dikinase
VRAATDITGFGLLGHASEMAAAGGVGFRVEAARVPLLDGAADYVRDKQIPGGTGRNRDFLVASSEGVPPRVRFSEKIGRDMMTLLFDPQTSGGLLAAVPADRADAVRAALADQDVPCWQIGEVVDGRGIEVV